MGHFTKDFWPLSNLESAYSWTLELDAYDGKNFKQDVETSSCWLADLIKKIDSEGTTARKPSSERTYMHVQSQNRRKRRDASLTAPSMSV